MSTNLHLVAADRRCDLIQTPTTATKEIYRAGNSTHKTLMRYFSWLEKHSHLGAGALLDHKLEVAMFLVKNPDARWSAV